MSDGNGSRFTGANKEIYGSIINISGRQRMLSQRIAMFCQWLVNSTELLKDQAAKTQAQNDLLQALNLFEESHNALTKGSQALGLPGPTSDRIHAMYYEEPDAVDQPVRCYIEYVRGFYKHIQSNADEARAFIPKIMASALSILDPLNKIVAQYQSESDALIAEVNKKLEEDRIKLASYANNLEQMVEQRTAEVVEGKKKIKNILVNIGQGILTFRENMAIESEFSDFLANLYECDRGSIAGRPVLEFVFQGAKFSNDRFDRFVQNLNFAFGSNMLSWEIGTDHLITEAEIRPAGKPKYVSLQWTPVLNDAEEIDQMVLSVRDISIEKELERKFSEQSAANEKTTTIISEIIAVSRNQVTKFLEELPVTMERVQTNVATPECDTKKVFIDLHTIKGVARSFAFTSLAEVIHNAETLLKKWDGKDAETRASLQSMNQQILEEHKRYFQVCFEILGGKSSSGSSEGSTLQNIVASHLLGLKSHLDRHNLKIQRISCIDEVIHWNEQNLSELKNILIQAINNAVDHGYIHPHARGEFNEFNVRLLVAALKRGADLMLVVADQGVGLNLDRIRKLAAEKGIPFNNEQDVVKVLTHGNISTAEKVTQFSGRGVGLSVIYDVATEFGGQVTLQKNATQGTKLMVRLPGHAFILDKEGKKAA